ncbi:MAG: ATP-binding protein [Sphingomonadaceae bacterium]
MTLPNPRHLPIRLRLAVGYAFFLVAILAGVGFYLLTALANNLQMEADEVLRLRAYHAEREIVQDRSSPLDPAVLRSTLANLGPTEEFSEPGIYVQVLDPSGTPIASSLNLPRGELPVTPRLVSDALAGQEGYANVPVGRERIRVFARPVERNGRLLAVVLVGESMHPLDATLRRLQQLLVGAAAGAALLSMLGGWWFTTRAMGPITDVIRVARRIAATGRFEQRITTPPARDELGQLVATFNDMLDRLEDTFRRQKEFLADASHELRGPLMVIRGNLDLLKMELPGKERRECVQDACEELDRMSRMVSDLLFLAQVDAQEEVEHQPVALHQVVLEAWERARAVDAGVHRIVVTHNDPSTVLGDQHRLDQMLWNLVENALRYTPPGGQVNLALRNHGDIAELTVADTGTGIPAELLPRVFERFFRVDKARSREHGGAGLGLAIVKQVAEAHGGQVRVRSSSSEGTVFAVALPVYSEAKPHGEPSAPEP